MFANLKYYVLLHLIIFIWGFTGILGKLIHLESIPIVWYRVIIAFVALFIALKFMKRELWIKSYKYAIAVMLVGVLVALHWVTFYASIQLSTASLGILCLSTTTIHVAWLEPLIMRRKPQLLEFVFGAVVVYGIYFVSDDFTMDEYVALGLGLLSALLAATFSVFNAKFIQTISATKITLYEMFSASVFLTIVLLVTGDFNCARITPSISDVLWLLFLGVICTSFAFLANIEVVKRLGAFTVSLSINLEPVYTIILAIFILNENELLGVDFYIGSTLIVFVVLLNAVLKSSQRKTQNNLSN